PASAALAAGEDGLATPLGADPGLGRSGRSDLRDHGSRGGAKRVAPGARAGSCGYGSLALASWSEGGASIRCRGGRDRDPLVHGRVVGVALAPLVDRHPRAGGARRGYTSVAAP